MACNEWEESALLYCSNELCQEMVTAFEEHIEVCEGCKAFYNQYKKESLSLFTMDVLGEEPSENISNEIQRVCISRKKQYTNIGILSSVVKKSFVSVSFFLIGFVVVGYFLMNVHQVGSRQESVVRENNLIPSSSSVPLINVANTTDAIDKLKDSIESIPDSNRYFSKNRGNLDLKGVVPVDLSNK